MAKVTIIGGGQSGLQLGVGLVQGGYDVTIVTDRTPEEIHDGRVTSSQCMFASALDNERALGLDFWEDTCPPVEGIALAVPHPEVPGARAIDWGARLDRIAQSVDQRVKFPRWMEHFDSIGGTLVFESVTLEGMERHAAESDLLVVAAGKGDIVRFFERDAERSTFDQPMRALALTYVTGMTPRPDFPPCASTSSRAWGSTSVPCADDERALRDHGLRGRPRRADGLLGRRVDAGRASRGCPGRSSRRSCPGRPSETATAELTDANGTLVGRFPPTVRKPVGWLPSGTAGARHGRRRPPQRPDHGPGIEQRGEGRCDLPPAGSSSAARGRSTRSGCRRRSRRSGRSTPSKVVTGGRTRC